MSAASALRTRFSAVTILEQDIIPETPTGRRGVPQSWHNHFLLDRGRRALDDLFPGFTDHVLAEGGMMLDPAYDAVQCLAGGWFPRSRSEMRMLFASRPKFESCIRDLSRRDPNITYIEGARVKGLVHQRDAAGTRVTGVRYVDPDTGELVVLAADLVVDAGGRGSRCLNWMSELGVEIEEETLDARVSYSSRWYRWPDEDVSWWKWLTVLPSIDRDASVPEQYLCSIFPIEDNCFIAVMGSWGQPMPTTVDEFEAAYRSSRTAEFGRVLDLSEPLSDVHRTKSTRNVWRRFDRVTGLPDGYLALGDAVCAFNPIYAQGMTCASVSALILRDVLAESDVDAHGLPSRFYSRHTELVDLAWQLALTRDGAYDHARGSAVMADGVKKKLVTRYTWSGLQFISEAGFSDKAIDEHFDRVFNLHESLGELLSSPRVIFGLARFGVRKAFGRSPLPALRDPQLVPDPTDITHLRPKSTIPKKIVEV